MMANPSEKATILACIIRESLQEMVNIKNVHINQKPAGKKRHIVKSNHIKRYSALLKIAL